MKRISIIYPERIGRISPEIYGHFSEHIGGVFYDGLWVGRDSEIPNIRGFRKDLVEKLKAIRPQVLRWPGGCFAETYNWRDGIGENRPVRTNWWQHRDGRTESNAVGTHEFIDLCNIIGAKPYFAVNVTSITPLEALNWMDYCLSPRGTTALALEREKNGSPEPFDIPYWGIGNENWGDGGNMTPEFYALEYRRFATVLKNFCQDRAEVIIGGADGADYNWTEGITSNLAHAKRRIPADGMSFHYYCGCSGDCIDFTEEDWDILINKARRIEELIERHYAFAVAHGMKDRLRLVIDEWGCWHPQGSGPSKGYNLFEQQSTMRDGVISALTLNIFNNYCHCVKMANVAQLCNNLHCLFLAGGENCVVTPTYHVFDMFKEHQGAECLRTITSDDTVSVSASVKNGTVTVTLANLSCVSDAELSLDILGLEGEVVKTEATLLSSSDMRDHNTFECPDKVSPVSIKADPSSFVLPKASIMQMSIKIS